MLIEKGIPTICGFGPKGGAPHAPNGTSCAVTTRLFPLPLLTLHFNPRTEWVEVASLGSTVDIYYDIVCRYLDL